MAEEITKEIENVDELFKNIVINGQTFTSDKEIKPKTKRETPSQQPSPEPEPLPVPSEPVEVTKTVENIDEQFFEIVLNGTTIQSDKAPSTILKVTRSPKQNSVEIVDDPEPVKGQNVKTINLNNILHDFEDPNAYSEIQQIQTEINQLQTRLNNLLTLVPSQASASNKLADKAFVNSSVQTATANFRGNWNDFSSVPVDVSLYPVDYAGSKTPTVNDYLVVRDASDYTEETLEGTWRFKYSGTWSVEGKNGWRPEYQVNETPLTQAQLEALNSGITAQAVQNMAVIDDTTASSTKVYSSQKTVSLIPTKTSQLTNDSGYITGGNVYQPIAYISSDGNTGYFKIQISISQALYSMTYVLHAREGEAIFITVGQADNSTVGAVHCLRYANAYSKIGGIKWSATGLSLTIFVLRSAWSHTITFNQISGLRTTYTISNSNATEYNNAGHTSTIKNL